MKSKKNLWKLSWFRIGKEPWIWGLLVVCIYVILACNFECLKWTSLLCDDTTDKVNLIASTLAYSYVSGVMLYALSIFIPTTRKARFVLSDFVVDLEDMKTEFHEFANRFIGDDFTTFDAENLIFRKITGKDYEQISKEAESIEIPKDIIAFYKKLRPLLTSIMEKYEIYLFHDDYERLSNLRTTFIFNEIRISAKNTGPLAYTMKTLKEIFIKTLIENNKEIDSLYKAFSSVYGNDFR